MSKAPKKQSGELLATQYLRTIAERLGLDVPAVADLVEAVFADNPAVKAIQEGKDAFHTRCGTKCVFDIMPALSRPGEYRFLVHCPKCLRDLMEGEIQYVPHSE
jgi:hypothetical protein